MVRFSVAHMDGINQLNTVVFAGGILLNACCADNDGQTTNTEKIKQNIRKNKKLCYISEKQHKEN